jgi:hypothetical protein
LHARKRIIQNEIAKIDDVYVTCLLIIGTKAIAFHFEDLQKSSRPVFYYYYDSKKPLLEDFEFSILNFVDKMECDKTRREKFDMDDLC